MGCYRSHQEREAMAGSIPKLKRWHMFAAATAYLVVMLALVQLVSHALPIYDDFQISRNVTYLTVDNHAVKLDVYRKRGVAIPNATLIYFHGGGWIGGSKEADSLKFRPFLEMGWNVVNVEYRLAETALAPAAVQDAICALRWVSRNASTYNIDAKNLVLMGNSAGAHLALSAAIIPPDGELDAPCPSAEKFQVSAIVNWYGITDVNDLLHGPNTRWFAATWIGNAPDRDELAQRVSPLHYVRAFIPPIISIHGDADEEVPYAHSVRLHQALEQAGIRNRLVTIPGGNHGAFSTAEMTRAFAEIRDFLAVENVVAADDEQRTSR